MSGVKVDITGLSELQTTLSKLPGEVQETVGWKAVNEAAKVIQEEMRTRAPIRHPWAGGDSGKRITAGKAGQLRYPGNLKKNISRRRVQKQSGTKISYEVGPNRKAWYGRIVETGSIYAAAQPFMRPTLDAKATEAIDAFSDALGAGIDEAVQAAK